MMELTGKVIRMDECGPLCHVESIFFGDVLFMRNRKKSILKFAILFSTKKKKKKKKKKNYVLFFFFKYFVFCKYIDF